MAASASTPKKASREINNNFSTSFLNVHADQFNQQLFRRRGTIQ
ncbi:hypothetical protein JM48_1234 [Lactiplantibacillus plantarum]|nr:hypothetical protein JM48_1234 [Lactiplantibacillus plantarum]